MKFLVTLAIGLSLFGCVSAQKIPYTYEIKGKGGNTLVKEKYDVQVELRSTSLLLKITNKSDQTMRLITDESVLTGADGQTIRLVDSRTTIATRTQSQPPIIIPKKSTVNVDLSSTEGIMTQYGFIGDPIISGLDNLKAANNIGKEFGLTLAFKDFKENKFEDNIRFVFTGLNQPAKSNAKPAPSTGF